jgi:hypothetical protein
MSVIADVTFQANSKILHPARVIRPTLFKHGGRNGFRRK